MAICKCLGCMSDFDSSISLICPHCGYDQDTPKKEAYHLDPGHMLADRYIIGKSIGAGGFGITYVAWDTVLAKKLAVKEYFPSEFATRMIGTTEVCSYDGQKAYQFEAGLKSFVDEALRLAKLNQMDGIVHIYDSFVDNCTAYIIMEYVEGDTLMGILKQNGPLPYQQVIEYIVPVLNALDEVHKEGIIHRDIAPDNIKVDGNKVTLLDFGAARNATTQHSKSLSVIVKPGYAPEEQYRSHGNQGPWTDVYAMAAVMYHLITGKLPQESVERNLKDELKTPTELGFTLPVPLENAIMNALNIKAEHRIQSAKEFADALSGVIELERVLIKQEIHDEGKWTKKNKITAGIGAAVSFVVILAIILTTTSLSTFSAKGNIFPDLSGANEKQAEKLLKTAGFSVDTYKIVGILKNVDGEAGTIVWQEIEPGERMTGKNILCEVKMAEAEIVKEDKDSDTAIMPNLTAMNQSAASAALRKAGFTNFSFATKINDSFQEGLVCDQSLAADKKAKKDTEIVVYLAKNTEQTTRVATTAKPTITTTKPAATTQAPATTRAPEPTYAPEPAPKPVTPATTVPAHTVTTTLPPTTVAPKVSVPSVVGMDAGSAISTISSKDLLATTVNVSTTDVSLDGKVKSSSPGAGAPVEPGSIVTIYIYRYQAPAE